MMLSPHGEGQEGIRLPPPSHSMTRTGQDKEMTPPFSNHSFMYRPGEPFPQPVYAPIPPFSQTNLERAGMVHPNSSAFRPVTLPQETEKFHSAFLPAKKSKIEANLSFPSDDDSHEINSEISDGKDSFLSSMAKDERPSSYSSLNCDTNSEANSDIGDSENSVPDDARPSRKSRKKCGLDGLSLCCPVCGITLRPGEIEQHYMLEIDRIDKIARGGRKSRDSTPQSRKCQPSPSSSRRGKESPSLEVSSQSRFDSYLRVRFNRQSRLTSRSKNRKKKPDESTICPVCNERLVGCPDELNEHVELCLKRKGLGDDMQVDIEGDEDESFEEYTWAGQTRIRASSLLEGGYSGTGLTAAKKGVDEDVDVNVDDDEGEQYGKSQYSEMDIIPCSADEPKEDRERQALRGAFLRGTPVPESSKFNDNTYETCDPECCPTDLSYKADRLQCQQSTSGLVTSTKTDDIEERGDRSKCLICMEIYNNPLTSIQCWHVYCEQCWLKSLGAKKLCPQCNTITSPSDLRRIYM